VTISLPWITNKLSFKSSTLKGLRTETIYIYYFKCGWAKLDEIRRAIFNFKRSGKVTVAYVLNFGSKEYYVACACELVYVPPSAYVSQFCLAINYGLP
jgi:hypothetical protein